MSQAQHIIAFFLLNSFILFLGALSFMYIEYHHTELEKHENRTRFRQQIESELGFELNDTMFNNLEKQFDNFIHMDRMCKIGKYETGWKKEISARTFLRWLYFAATISTTIGYGDIVVESNAGKILVCVYAFLAIPIHLYTSFLIGRAINWLMKYALISIEVKILKKTKVEHRSAKVLFLSVVAGLLWIAISGILIKKKSNWTLVDSIYFTIISMLTIGFGDFTPSIDKLVPVHVYLAVHLYVGLAFLASAINGTVECLKKEQRKGFYNLSVKQTSIPVGKTDPYVRECSFKNNAFVHLHGRDAIEKYSSKNGEGPSHQMEMKNGTDLS